ncbi:signal peptidase II [Tumidithrix helvetica PCC 7403]|uniref:signal peptidase II n=1 Tax=Tumidithrix helvetica TaxID=3457545 RepID=UPI003CA2BBD4
MIKNLFFWIAASTWLLLDQATKYFAVQHLKGVSTHPLWEGVFHLTYAVNTGAAFSLFSGHTDGLKWVSFLVSVVLIGLGLWHNGLDRWEQVGYGCILAGAMGNGIDRFVSGYVVDFLDFRLIRFPVFNIADISINVGLVCLMIAVLRSASPKRSS